MSVRRINYTGRQKIERKAVRVAIQGEFPLATVSATFNLSEYHFPATAVVVLEAQAGWTVQRFDFGTVARQTQPTDCRLSEFDSREGIIFRVKVIATGDLEGQLLGCADGLRSASNSDQAKRRSFVVVRSFDLGQRLWRLEFDEHQPLLLVNKVLGSHEEFISRTDVSTLILPEILSKLLDKAMDTDLDESDPYSWQTMVLRQAEELAAAPCPDRGDQEAVEVWINEAVEAFAHRHFPVANFQSWLKGNS